MVKGSIDKEKIPDIQDSPSQIRIPLSLVGVSNIIRRLRISNQVYTASINAYIELPSEKRGAHLSRLVKTINDIVEDSMKKPYKSFQELLVDLCNRLFKTHMYTKRVGVEVKVKYFYRESNNPIDLDLEAFMDKSGRIEFFSTITVTGLTACPCAQAVFSAIEGIELDRTPTHMQRTLLRTTIKSRDSMPRINDIIDLMLDSFSGRLESYLDRVNEYKLIKKVLGNPLFAEDVARKTIHNLYKYLDTNGIDYVESISVLVESYDSIHPHNIIVKTEYTIGELRKLLSNT